MKSYPRYSKPGIKPKTKLKKSLEESGRFNYNDLKELSLYDNICWKSENSGDYYEYYDKARDSLEAKFDKIKNELLNTFPEKEEEDRKMSLIDYWSSLLDDSIPEKDSYAVKKLIKKILTDNFENYTADELDMIRSEFNDGFTYSTDAEEFISISARASVWTYYVSGSLKVGAKTFEVKNLSYDSEANRI